MRLVYLVIWRIPLKQLIENRSQNTDNKQKIWSYIFWINALKTSARFCSN